VLTKSLDWFLNVDLTLVEGDMVAAFGGGLGGAMAGVSRRQSVSGPAGSPQTKKAGN